MFENNNNNNGGSYTYSEVTYSPAEPEVKPAKKNGAGKVIAGLLAVVIIGGASGYGGAYLANRNSGSVSAQTSIETQKPSETEAPAKTEKASSKTESKTEKEESYPAVSLGGSKYIEASDVKDVLKKATPSVALITSKFNNQGTSTGTGIVFSADGYIVTNAHVVLGEQSVYNSYNYNYNDPFSFFEDFYNYNYGRNNTGKQVVEADEVTVTLSDEKEYKAKIIGSDANTDLAVLKIDAKGLTAAEIGDSSILEMGDTAITLGYPLGLGLSASTGIISGLDKEMTVEVAGGSATMTLLQTDASINPGNSGGPLLNSAGQVVGITSSKIASSSVDGVGFAIPITDAMPIIEELMTTGTVKNTVPKIGITGIDINTSTKRYYGLPVDKGVMVASVESGSCAEKAGIEEGDIIIGADGKDVDDMASLVSLKNKHKAGEEMTLTLARKDGNVDVTLVLDLDE